VLENKTEKFREEILKKKNAGKAPVP